MPAESPQEAYKTNSPALRSTGLSFIAHIYIDNRPHIDYNILNERSIMRDGHYTT